MAARLAAHVTFGPNDLRCGVVLDRVVSGDRPRPDRSGLTRNAEPKQRHPITVNEHAISSDHIRAHPRPVPRVNRQIVHGSRPAGSRTRVLVAVVDRDGARAARAGIREIRDGQCVHPDPQSSWLTMSARPHGLAPEIGVRGDAEDSPKRVLAIAGGFWLARYQSEGAHTIGSTLGTQE